MNSRFIPVKDLKFDPDNPRLPIRVRGDQLAILEWMVANEKIVELMLAIGERGYFPGEPVLVVEAPDEDDKFVVVEGNRRLAAVRLLGNPELATVKRKSVQSASESAKHRPDKVPAIVFEQRDEILEYLGYRHITGVEAWDSLAKARYLKLLFEWTEAGDLTDKYRELARSIGSRADYVERLLIALAVYEAMEEEEFFDIRGLDEETISFSILSTALYYSSLAEYLELSQPNYPNLNINRDRLKELATWLFEKNTQGRTRLGESRNLKYLASVVESPKALARFKMGESLEQAAMLTEVPTHIFKNAILEAKKRLLVANNYFYEVDEVVEEDMELLSDIVRLAQDIQSKIKGRLTEEPAIQQVRA